MQPSSNTPMIAFSRRNCSANARPKATSSAPSSRAGRSWTWLRSWTSLPVSNHVRRPVERPLVGEVDTPQRRVLDPGLRQTRRQVQQADEAGERAVPVRHHHDRPAVRPQPGEHVMAVLPHPLDDEQRRVRRQRGEHLQPLALAVDEPVPGLLVEPDGRAPTLQPNDSTARVTSASNCSCTGQHFTFADGRRSPLATVYTVRGGATGDRGDLRKLIAGHGSSSRVPGIRVMPRRSVRQF